MKISSFLASTLFALGLSGAAQASVHAAPTAPTAHAIIEAEKCVPNAATRCLVSADGAAADDERDELAPLAKANAQQPADAAATAVPEPQTFAMMALGLALLGFASRRRPPSDKFEN